MARFSFCGQELVFLYDYGGHDLNNINHIAISSHLYFIIFRQKKEVI